MLHGLVVSLIQAPAHRFLQSAPEATRVCTNHQLLSTAFKPIGSRVRSLPLDRTVISSSLYRPASGYAVPRRGFSCCARCTHGDEAVGPVK
jgi:hypothetical protein